MYRGYTMLTHYKANLSRQQRRFEEAEQYYRRAIALFDVVQDHYGRAQCILDYARMLRIWGKEDEVQMAVGSALAIYKERGTEEQVRKVQVWLEGKVASF
jgi:tetratricopeptide (TPR) repeat protein